MDLKRRLEEAERRVQELTRAAPQPLPTYVPLEHWGAAPWHPWRAPYFPTGLPDGGSDWGSPAAGGS